MRLARIGWAIWDPIRGRDTRQQNPVRLTLHTAWVNVSDLYGPQKGQGQTYAHFYAPTHNRLRQHQELYRISRADLNGNGTTVSIESQDERRAMPWSENQLNIFARLFADLVMAPGSRIPNRIATVNDTRGLAWHRLGVRGNFGRYNSGITHITTWSGNQSGQRWTNAAGKTCPTDPRIRQIPEIYRRAQVYMKGGAPKPIPVKRPKPVRDVVDIQLILAVLGHYDAGPGGKYLDGKFESATVAATMAYQKGKKSLAPDGDWGKATDRYFERNDMAKVLDQIGSAVWGTIHANDTRNYGFIMRTINRDTKRAVASQSGLLKAIEQISAGKPVDLAAIAAAAEEGATRAFVVGDLADALAEALAESLPEQEAGKIADNVVARIGERLIVEETQ